MFSTLCGTYFSFQIHFKMLSAICSNLDQSKILSSGNSLTTFKKKVLENIIGKGLISPFSTVFSILLENFPSFSDLIKFKIVVCKFFDFGRVHNLSFGKELTLYQMTVLDWSKFKAFVDYKIHVAKIVFEELENVIGKGENARLAAFSPFPAMFT